MRSEVFEEVVEDPIVAEKDSSAFGIYVAVLPARDAVVSIGEANIESVQVGVSERLLFLQIESQGAVPLGNKEIELNARVVPVVGEGNGQFVGAGPDSP